MNKDNVFPRPRLMTIAIALLWISLVFGIIEMLIGWRLDHTFSTLNPWVALSAMFITCAFSIWIIFMISGGRNWARIVFLIYTIVALFFFISTIRLVLNQPWIVVIFTFISWLLHLVALYIIFLTPSARWFKRGDRKNAEY